MNFAATIALLAALAALVCVLTVLGVCLRGTPAAGRETGTAARNRRRVFS